MLPDRLRRQRERGAISTIVAIFFAGGVIMGLLAISIDVGNIMYERRQLQNAADATSLALAAECAADADNCVPSEVDDLLGANSRDGASKFSGTPYDEGACANGTTAQVGEALSDCTVDGVMTDLSKCPPLPDWVPDDVPYVETYSATERAGGEPELFLPFSKMLVNGPAKDVSVTACARAAWGKPVGYSATLPITISTCQWLDQTMHGTNYVAEGPVGVAPGYGGAGQPAWPGVAREVVVLLHDPSDETSDCDWNGKQTAGGFGSLESGSTCEAMVSEDDWAQIEPGAGSGTCKDVLNALINTVVEIPIFDCIMQSDTAPSGAPPTTPLDVCDPTTKLAGGKKSWYHMAGWAKFYVSGFALPGVGSGSTMPGGNSGCGVSGGKCLMGWFLTGAISDAPDIAPPGGDDDFGTYVVKPIG